MADKLRTRYSVLPYASRFYNSGSVANGVSVNATIHHLSEMDQAVLSDREDVKYQRPQAKTARSVLLTPAGQQQISIGELRKRVQAEGAAQLAKAIADFHAGWRWEQKGRQSLAKMYYQRALKQDIKDDLREKITSGLRRMLKVRKK